MTDHTKIPGTIFVSSPGPLRLGDYVRPWGVNTANTFVVIDPNDEVSDRRVIPIIKPLDVPEPSTETRADMEAHAELVVAVDDDEPGVRMARAHDLGEYDCGLASGRWALWWGPIYPNEWALRSAPGTAGETDDSSESDAVLWVVEGRQP